MTGLLLSTVAVLLLLSIPIGIALGAASWLSIVIDGKIPGIIVTQRLMSGMNHFTMIAVVFFILAGEIMTEGGISKKLVSLANNLVGKLPGGLAMVATLSAAFFGAISGSSAATTAAIGWHHDAHNGQGRLQEGLLFGRHSRIWNAGPNNTSKRYHATICRHSQHIGT